MAAYQYDSGERDACAFIRALAKERAGLVFDASKDYFIQRRLQPLLKKRDLSLNELVDLLRRRPKTHIETDVVECLTVNETSFYRDVHPFESLRNHILPQLHERRSATRSLNIWCAASSTGQEPYSLAILLRESFPDLDSWKINFIASDVDNSALDQARLGIYTRIEINRGLPDLLRQRYFEPVGDKFRIAPSIASMVQFKRINLCSGWPLLPEMDLILMRNVLIYFDQETKAQILARVQRLVRQDGFFMIGASEVSLSHDPRFERVQSQSAGIYRPVPRGGI